MTILIFITLFSWGCASSSKRINDEEKQAAALEESDSSAGLVSDIRMSEFVIGSGDTIEIEVYRHEDLKKTVRIDSSGSFMFPLIGDIQADGKGVISLRNEMRERLSRYLVDPQVTINVTEVHSQKIMVLGEVQNPGIFKLESNVTVLEAITMANGMTNDAGLENILLIKAKEGKSVVESLDLSKSFKDGNISNNRLLQSSDIVYVPAKTISNLSRYFSHLSKILGPIVNLGSGIVIWDKAIDIVQGDEGNETSISIPVR